MGVRICDPVILQGTVDANYCNFLVSTMVIGTIKMLSKVPDAEHSLSETTLVTWLINSSVYLGAPPRICVFSCCSCSNSPEAYIEPSMYCFRNYQAPAPSAVTTRRKHTLSHLCSVSGTIKNLSPQLWQLQHLTALYLNDNSLFRIPSSIALLQNLRWAIFSC